MLFALRPPAWPTYAHVCAHMCAYVCAVQGCGVQPSSCLQPSPEAKSEVTPGSRWSVLCTLDTGLPAGPVRG